MIKDVHFDYQLPKPHSATALSRHISSPADHEWLNKMKSSFCTNKTISLKTQLNTAPFTTHNSASARHVKIIINQLLSVQKPHTKNNISSALISHKM